MNENHFNPAPPTTRREEILQLCHADAVRRARIIGAAAWYESACNVLTDAEKAEVKALWMTMATHTSWTDAFLRWIAVSDAAMAGIEERREAAKNAPEPPWRQH